MQIDWITVGAQIVNFLVLVFLLKHFLYGPITEAMARRENRIARRLEDARAREGDADRRANEYREKLESLERRKEEILAEAREDADRERHSMLDEAREELSARRAEWRAEIARERDEFLGDFRHEIAGAVESLVRKALADLADTALEDRVIDVFLDKLDELDDDAAQAFAASESGLLVRTSFELDGTRRGRVTRALHERFARELAIEYERDDGLVCGIELRGADRRVTWTVAGYLDAAESAVRKRLVEVAESRRAGDDAGGEETKDDGRPDERSKGDGGDARQTGEAKA